MTVRRWTPILVLVLAFCGISISAYAALRIGSGTPLLCGAGELSGCTTIVADSFTTYLSVLLAWVGAFFYCALFILTALELLLAHDRVRRLLRLAALTGSVILLLAAIPQLFASSVLCRYCIVSTLVAAATFVAAILLEPWRMGEGSTSAMPRPPYLPMPPV